MRQYSLRVSLLFAALTFVSPSPTQPLQPGSAHAKPKKRGAPRKAAPAAPAAEVTESEAPVEAAPVAAEAPAATPAAPTPAAPVETPAAAPAATATPTVDEAAVADQKIRDEHQATVEQLRARYDELRDAVFRSRARRETLEKALFSTKFRAALTWEANRNYSLDKAELRLDGTRIWESGDRPIGDDPVVLDERRLPPGPHVLGIRIEVHSRENPRLGYTSEQSYTLMFPEGKRTEVEITMDEDGDLPSFNPDIEIDVEVE